ncbi:hypothetical protein [Allokutzneria oryzae]|uniref:Uncharacterized protein n=1 Tax=Allokutzneria oryzae TaxID=1378989 RepID=A0ABV5ZQB4_9PSEU
MTNRSLGAVLVLAGLLTACGANPAVQPPQVASLPGATSGAATMTTSSAADRDSGRPQIRLDSTPEDINRAWKPYNICLKDNGHRMYAGRADGTSPDYNDKSDTAKTALRTCAGKLPMQPPETDRATNPSYLDDYRDYMKCLTGRGLAVHAIEPYGTGWTYDDGVTQTLSSEQQQKVELDCKVEAFSDR